MPKRRKQSEKKQVLRKMRQLDKKGRVNTTSRELYTDNRGIEYDYKWLAQISSLSNFVMSCFKNGFPVIIKKLWYPAWAFYPIFFIGPKAWDADSIYTLNHERIHIRQQRELLLLFLPIFIGLSLIFGIKIFLLYLFVPTITYMIDFFHVAVRFVISGKKLRVSTIRARTSFELEATINSSDLDYLLRRKTFSTFRYLLRVIK